MESKILMKGKDLYCVKIGCSKSEIDIRVQGVNRGQG